MRKLFALAVLFLCVLLSPNVFAQTTNATLGGTVADSTGALIPGVSITATNTQTGIVNKLITNEAGAYQFASLQTGTYSVQAELPGFQTRTLQAGDVYCIPGGVPHKVVTLEDPARAIDVFTPPREEYR